MVGLHVIRTDGDTRYNPRPRRVLVPLYPAPRPGPAFFRHLARPGQAVDAARDLLAAVLGVRPEDVSFTASGTDALRSALSALRRRDGDEVVLPSFGCPALVESVLAARMRPVFADIGEDFNLDPVDAERRIGPRTRVLLAPHTFGTPCDMARLSTLAGEHGIDLVDDASQALGEVFAGRPVGTWGHAGVLSFGRHKPVFAAGGGALIWNAEPERRPVIATAAPAAVGRSLRASLRALATDAARRVGTAISDRAGLSSQGFDDAVEALEHVLVDAGPGAAFDAVQGSLLLDQLSRLDLYRERTHEWVRRYATALPPGASITAPASAIVAGGLNFVPLRCAPERRHSIAASLAARGVETTWLYFPLHRLRRYRALDPDARLPRTEAAWRRTLCVPARGWHSERAIRWTAEALAEAAVRV